MDLITIYIYFPDIPHVGTFLVLFTTIIFAIAVIRFYDRVGV